MLPLLLLRVKPEVVDIEVDSFGLVIMWVDGVIVVVMEEEEEEEGLAEEWRREERLELEDVREDPLMWW